MRAVSLLLGVGAVLACGPTVSLGRLEPDEARATEGGGSSSGATTRAEAPSHGATTSHHQGEEVTSTGGDGLVCELDDPDPCISCLQRECCGDFAECASDDDCECRIFCLDVGGSLARCEEERHCSPGWRGDKLLACAEARCDPVC